MKLISNSSTRWFRCLKRLPPVTWLIHMCNTTFCYVWYDSFICLTQLLSGKRLIHTCDVTSSYLWYGLFVCLTWLSSMCGMAHSYVYTRLIYTKLKSDSITGWFQSLRRLPPVTWLIHMCDTTSSYESYGSFICLTRLSYTCGVAHAYVWQDPLIWKKNPIQILSDANLWDDSPCDMTHAHVRHVSLTCVIWLIHMFHVAHLCEKGKIQLR